MNINDSLSEVSVLIDGTPADINQALELLRNILEMDSTNERAYELLVQVMKNAPTFSEAAKEISLLYTSSSRSIDTLMEQADNAYYSGEYTKAIDIYERILNQEPEYSRAKEQIEKARLLQTHKTAELSIPRGAMQHYRRARSYINAGVVEEARQSLDQAIQTAQENGVTFPQAEQLLDSLTDALLSNELKGNARLALENLELTKALEFAQMAEKLDPSDIMLNALLAELNSVLNIQREISSLETESTCDSPLYDETLVKLTHLQHPWILRSRVVENLISEVADIRKRKSDYFEQQGLSQMERAKDALYLSVMAELSGKAIENFECALACNPQKINLLSLISEAKAIKDRVESILGGDESSVLDYIQEKNEKKKHIGEITKRMELVILEFDSNSGEYKSLWTQLESLFDKKTKSLSASEDRVAVVLAKVDAEIKNIRDRRPWITTLVIAIILIVVSGILLAINPKRTMVPFPADFPADLVLYASLFGSAIRVVVDLFDRSRTKWVDTVRLTILRPLIGMGVTVLIVLFVYAGLGTILAFSPAMGFWGYVSLSSILGYSDSIMNKIITILEKGISIKV